MKIRFSFVSGLGRTFRCTSVKVERAGVIVMFDAEDLNDEDSPVFPQLGFNLDRVVSYALLPEE